MKRINIFLRQNFLSKQMYIRTREFTRGPMSSSQTHLHFIASVLFMHKSRSDNLTHEPNSHFCIREVRVNKTSRNDRPSRDSTL